ncbi:MAG: polysaccharide deacetylase family protein [Candidatus Brocadiaceae bacterium]|nr:polysaccharide deacetylase family protein [Candidatus Brocadiaceae bacterium]
MNVRNYVWNAILSARRFTLNIFDTPAVVLLYHRITDLKKDPQLLTVSPENFYAQCEYLKRHYHVLNVDEFVSLKIQNKPFPENSALLTFDDGYDDNLLLALPILESLNLQAVFYVSTLNLDTKFEYWWDELGRIFLNGNNLPESLDIEIHNREYYFSTSSEHEQFCAYEKLRRIMRQCKFNVQKDILTKLLLWAKIEESGRETHRSMTSNALKKMLASESAIIGAHGHTHTQMSLYAYAEQYKDIKYSKDIIESLLGIQVKLFAYPFGMRNDYNADTIKICKELRFDLAFSNYYSQVHSWTDRYQIPRILVRNWDFIEFKSKIKSFFRY